MCRVVYERRKERRQEREHGSFTYSCGHLFARWKGFVVPIFTPLEHAPERPRRKPSGALNAHNRGLIDPLQEINGRGGERLESRASERTKSPPRVVTRDGRATSNGAEIDRVGRVYQVSLREAYGLVVPPGLPCERETFAG